MMMCVCVSVCVLACMRVCVHAHEKTALDAVVDVAEQLVCMHAYKMCVSVCA